MVPGAAALCCPLSIARGQSHASGLGTGVMKSKACATPHAPSETRSVSVPLRRLTRAWSQGLRCCMFWGEDPGRKGGEPGSPLEGNEGKPPPPERALQVWSPRVLVVSGDGVWGPVRPSPSFWPETDMDTLARPHASVGDDCVPAGGRVHGRSCSEVLSLCEETRRRHVCTQTPGSSGTSRRAHTQRS